MLLSYVAVWIQYCLPVDVLNVNYFTWQTPFDIFGIIAVTVNQFAVLLNVSVMGLLGLWEVNL